MFIDINREHVDAIRTRGLIIDGARGDHTLPRQIRSRGRQLP